MLSRPFTREMTDQSMRVAMPKVNRDTLGAALVPLPPISTQQQITDFLDRETAYIDRLIEKKERLIKLLKEKRSALITRAVTKGLDPDVPMKHSGVEWIGEIPETWCLTPLKRLLTDPLCYGVLVPDKYGGKNGVPLLRIVDLSRGERVVRDDLDRISPKLSGEYPRSILASGDVVVSVVGSLGTSMVVSSRLAGVNISRALAKVRCSHRLLPDFLARFLQSDAFLRFVDLHAGGTAQRVLNLDDLNDCPVPVPDLAAQQEVVSTLRISIDQFTSTLDATRRSITLLQERRSSLITAAVTGQIDVEEYQASRKAPLAGGDLDADQFLATATADP